MEVYQKYHPLYKITVLITSAPDKKWQKVYLGIIFHITPLKYMSHRDGSNEGSQHMFSLKNKTRPVPK